MSERGLHQNNLLAACAQGNCIFVKNYIQRNRKKGKFKVFDNHKWGPLHHAVSSNSYECVELLLSSRCVNTRWKSFEGHTCLFIAIKRSVSVNIIKRLLIADPMLFNIASNENVYPIHHAVLLNSFDTVKTMVETLKELNTPIMDQFDWDNENSLFLAVRMKNLQMINYLIDNIQCRITHTNQHGLNIVSIALLPTIQAVDDEHHCALELVKRFVPLVFDQKNDDCMQKMMLSIGLSCEFKWRGVFNWFMEQFYMNESNEHRHLVRKTLDTFQLDNMQYQYILIGIHSKITKYLIEENNEVKNNIIYRNFIGRLQVIFRTDRTLFIELMQILCPKLSITNFNSALFKFLPNTSILGTYMLSELIEMFDVMHFCDIIDMKNYFQPSLSIKHLAIALPLLMPFSVETSADVYLENCVQYKNIATISNNLNNIFSKFCSNGKFRIQNLKSLARHAVRSFILEKNTNLPNSQRLMKLRTLQIPRELTNFLLFNYSYYKF